MSERALRVSRLQKEVARAEQRATDGENMHLSTMSRMAVYVEQHASWATVAEFVRDRSNDLMADGMRAGRRSLAAGEGGSEDEGKVRAELIRQRDKMHQTVEQLAAELQRTRAKSRDKFVNLSGETQRAMEQLNEARRQTHELSHQLETAAKQLAFYEARQRRQDAKGIDRGRTAPELPSSMPPAIPGANVLRATGGLVTGPSGMAGLKLSATQPELRPRPQTSAGVGEGVAAWPVTSLASSSSMPSTGGVPISPPVSTLMPKPGAGSAGLELSEHLEQHVLENQRLREQLLHYTSKAPGKGNKKPAKVSSLGIPLPPV